MELKMNKFPLVSIVIPTFNSQSRLTFCLQSIKKQTYPANRIEIIIADGGSTDSTLEIAKKFHCVIVKNEKRLAEYGVALGSKVAKGDFIIIMAADNELGTSNYIKRIIVPFIEDKNILITYPKHTNSIQDNWITQYINTFTDPVNHFIYADAANARTFHKIYPIVYSSIDYVVYRFSSVDYPLIALAQGTTIRKDFQRKEFTYGDDISPIIEMIEKGYGFAYVPNALIFHHTISSLTSFIKKQQWAIDNILFKKKYGIQTRIRFFSKARYLRKALWPVYAVSIILPLLWSIWGLIVGRKKEWIYHSVLTYITVLILILEIIRVKILSKKEHKERK